MIKNTILRCTASGEWSTVIIISVQLIILTVLYPWERLKTQQ